MSNYIDISSAANENGNIYYNVKADDQDVWVEASSFSQSDSANITMLRKHGLMIAGKNAVEQLQGALCDIKQMPDIILIESPGWMRDYRGFCSPDGTIIGKGNDGRDVAVFVASNICHQAGSRKDWKKSVAGELSGQSLAMFTVMSALAAPLLPLLGLPGFCVEISGKKGTGKSTLQEIAASIYGSSDYHSDSGFGSTLADYLAYPHETNALYTHLPLIIDDIDEVVADSPPAACMDVFKKLVFGTGQLAAGHRKAHNPSVERGSVKIMSTNCPLVDLVGQSSETALAASDRIISLPIPPHYDFGVFDHLPSGFVNSSDYVDSILLAARTNYGHVGKEFLRLLHEDIGKDKAKLLQRLEKSQRMFIKKASIDTNNGAEMRIGKLFGAIYAAARYAQERALIPKGWQLGSAALHCYNIHRNSSIVPMPFEARLRDVAKRKSTIDTNDKTLSRKLGNAPVMVTRKNSYMEVLIRTTAIATVFPDWPKLKKTQTAKALMKTDGKHITVKRKVGSDGKSERVHCFRLPPKPAVS